MKEWLRMVLERFVCKHWFYEKVILYVVDIDVFTSYLDEYRDEETCGEMMTLLGFLLRSTYRQNLILMKKHIFVNLSEN